MIIVNNTSTDPAFNLAAEEYLCDKAEDDIFMLWRNSPSVIIGRNQNTWAEVDTEYTKENGIQIVRRMTGGGAVFHDPGNVNFSFIIISDVRALDFSRFTAPVISALKEMGVEAEADGRNDIVTPYGKISGNAQLVRQRKDGKQVQLHHGTLLFSADMSKLGGALRPSPDKLKSKGVASVRSRVCNIVELPGYTGPANVLEFADALGMRAAAEYGAELSRIDPQDIGAIEKLAGEKYRSWEWNFGKSPAFSQTKSVRCDAGTVTVMYDAKDGVISEIRIFGDFFGSDRLGDIEEALVGCRVDGDAVKIRLNEKNIDCSDIIYRMSGEELAKIIAD